MASQQKSGKGFAVVLILLAALVAIFIFVLPPRTSVKESNAELDKLNMNGLPRPAMILAAQPVENVKLIAVPLSVKEVKTKILEASDASKTKAIVSGEDFPVKASISGKEANLMATLEAIAGDVYLDETGQIAGSTPLVVIDKFKLKSVGKKHVMTIKVSPGFSK